MNKDRIYSIAQFMIQVSITMLPIGAGVSGFIAQQGRTMSTFFTLALVWLGLLVVAGSVFINLKVIRTRDPATPAERESLEQTFNLAVIVFIIGIFFIVVSPAGFAINQLFAPPNIPLKTTSNDIKFALSDVHSNETNVVLIASDLPMKDYAELSIRATVTDDSCLAITNVGEQSPAFDHDIWLTIWRISINPGCPTGDYAVTFKALERGSLRGQTQIVVKITP